MTLIRFALHFARQYERGMLNRWLMHFSTHVYQRCKSSIFDDDGPPAKDDYKSEIAIHVAH